MLLAGPLRWRWGVSPGSLFHTRSQLLPMDSTLSEIYSFLTTPFEEFSFE